MIAPSNSSTACWWRRGWATWTRSWPSRSSSLLRDFVVPRNLGLVSGPDGSLRLFPGLVRIPDIAFVSWARIPGGRIPEEPIPGPRPRPRRRGAQPEQHPARDGPQASALFRGRRPPRLDRRPQTPDRRRLHRPRPPDPARRLGDPRRRRRPPRLRPPAGRPLRRPRSPRRGERTQVLLVGLPIRVRGRSPRVARATRATRPRSFGGGRAEVGGRRRRERSAAPIGVVIARGHEAGEARIRPVARVRARPCLTGLKWMVSQCAARSSSERMTCSQNRRCQTPRRRPSRLAGLTVAGAASVEEFAGERPLDPGPPSRVGRVAGRERPDRVQVVGEQDNARVRNGQRAGPMHGITEARPGDLAREDRPGRR